ncbi:MAG: small basic protein [Planctomycetota bacterium]
MSIDRSLKTSGNLASVRSVMTRAERIEKLKTDGKFDPKKNVPLGLPKTIPVVK